MAIQQRATATRQKLVLAAVRLFADKGYLQTTPKEIAEAAELTTGAFYYHFTSKEELAAAIIEQSFPAVQDVLARYLGAPGCGIGNIVKAGFALTDLINRDPAVWVSLHLDTAIGHLNPAGRVASRERLQAFPILAADAFRDSEIRDGLSRRDAGELLWIALTGAQLASDVCEDAHSTRLHRMAMAWSCALRAVVSDEMVPDVMELVDEMSARYGAAPADQLAVAARVA